MMNLKISVSSGSITFDKKHLKDVMRGAGREVATVTRRLIGNSKGGQGRRYRRPGDMRYRTFPKNWTFTPYNASAPGSPPQRVTGTLYRGISVKVTKDGEMVIIKDKVFYSRFLEFGAHGPGKRVMEPRPFLTRALDTQRAGIETRIRDALETGAKFVKAP